MIKFSEIVAFALGTLLVSTVATCFYPNKKVCNPPQPIKWVSTPEQLRIEGAAIVVILKNTFVYASKTGKPGTLEYICGLTENGCVTDD